MTFIFISIVNISYVSSMYVYTDSSWIFHIKLLTRKAYS